MPKGGKVIADVQRRKSKGDDISRQSWLSTGKVVNTNDPHQMGRVQVYCPGFGDKPEKTIKNLPWAMYVSPLGGLTNYGSRGAPPGPGEEPAESDGGVAYGMWTIPEVGSYVLVGCVDGVADLRFYMGCIHPQYLTHTMPHGRYTWNNVGTEAGKTPDGPVDTLENPIQPLYDKQTQQFTKSGTEVAEETPAEPRENMEWRTRGVDCQVSAINQTHVERKYDAPGSNVADHEPGSFIEITEEDGTKRIIGGPGYGIDQLDPDAEYPETGGVNYNSMIHSWTTPGFHAFSMDDRHENCRIRVRTTAGHQIIMDDTNERIYINTAGGETWIELDQAGNIDIYASKDISTHAGGDISFVADKTFRVQAKEGIHFQTDDVFRVQSTKRFDLRTDDEMYIESVKDMHVKTSAIMYVNSTDDMHIKTDAVMYVNSTDDMHIKTDAVMYINSADDMHIKTDAALGVESGTTMDILAGGAMEVEAGPSINMNAGTIDLNSGGSAFPADPATAATAAMNAYYAFIAARVPQHEPWARIYSDPATADQDATANTFTPKPAAYNDTTIGRQDRDGADLGRNPLWHR